MQTRIFLFNSFIARGAKVSITAILLTSCSTVALANCVTTGNTTTCDSAAPNPYTTTVGAGNAPAGDNQTVNVNSDSSINITAGNASAISLRNNANITVNGTVRNAATSGGGNYPGPGGWNTIEFNDNGSLIVNSGGSVTSAGNQSNAEAVNVFGTNNSILNRGTIGTTNNATKAIWLQNGGNLTIDNYGTIYAGNQTDNNNTNQVIGGSGASNITLYNRTGAKIYGSLALGTGNDTVYLYTGSFISGSIDGGAGSFTDKLYLVGDGSQSLTNSVTNFQNLYKQDSGTWTIPTALSVSVGAEIQAGILSVTGTLTAPTTSISSGATLQGTGTVVATSGVTNNGTIAPGLGSSAGDLRITGNLINNGTVNPYDYSSNLRITGNYTQSNGANFVTHVNSLTSGGYSTIVSSGTVNMASGSVITADLKPSLKLNDGDVIPGVIKGATLGTQGAITVNTISSRYRLDYRYSGGNQVDLYLAETKTLDKNDTSIKGTYIGALEQPTLTSISQVLNPTLGMMHQRYAVLNAVMQYDCNQFSSMNFCISAAARSTGFGPQATGAGVFNIAYRPTEQVRVGAFLDYQVAAGNPAVYGNYSLSNENAYFSAVNNGSVQSGYDNATFGGYAGWSQSGYSQKIVNNGFQVFVSGGYNPGKVSVTRAAAVDPFLGFFDSQPGSNVASLNSYFVRGMAGYGIALTDMATLMPYAGLRYTDITRGGYMENYNAVVLQPLVFNSYYERLLTGFGGAMLNGRITDKFGTLIGLGVETDFNRSANSFSGYSPLAIGSLVAFGFDHGGAWNGLRPTGNLGAYYDIAPNQRISLNGYAGQQSWTTRTYTTGLLGYQVAF